MTTHSHTGAIDWPNGGGYTPCTKEYEAKMAERDAIYDANYDEGSLEDLSPDQYNRWHQLNDELCTMQAHGHLGKPVRL
jgi:hypothetical protein